MATNYLQPGKTLELTAPTGGVVSGGFYKIGSMLVVACHDAAQTEKFSATVEGVFEAPKTTGQAWTEGLLLYWDDSGKKVTTTSTSNLVAGHAVAAADSADTVGLIRLNQSGVTAGA